MNVLLKKDLINYIRAFMELRGLTIFWNFCLFRKVYNLRDSGLLLDGNSKATKTLLFPRSLRRESMGRMDLSTILSRGSCLHWPISDGIEGWALTVKLEERCQDAPVSIELQYLGSSIMKMSRFCCSHWATLDRIKYEWIYHDAPVSIELPWIELWMNLSRCSCFHWATLDIIKYEWIYHDAPVSIELPWIELWMNLSRCSCFHWATLDRIMNEFIKMLLFPLSYLGWNINEAFKMLLFQYRAESKLESSSFKLFLHCT
jgi:hypothetical protein